MRQNIGTTIATRPNTRKNDMMTPRYSTQTDQTGRCVPLHDEEGFAGMRRAGRLAAETLDFITPHVKAGITTLRLDELCADFIRAKGAIPATVGYRGYRHSSCISVNHVVTHGIPSAGKTLKD